jgi:hypothetical protein
MKTIFAALTLTLTLALMVWQPARAYDRPEFKDLPNDPPLQSRPVNPDAPDQSSARKKIICGITLNSAAEIKTFVRDLRANQPDSQFKFVELTKMGTADTWWRNAGRSNIQCDILLVSSHFGGDLFGDHTKIRLSLSQLEKASCDHTHDGILRHPKEVFLFTCNMLAGKQHDVRTPRQYYQVLLHYYTPEMAQYYVQTRYGAWGGTFVGRTTRAFYGVSHLYGYDSVSPLGKENAAWVDQYLTTIGNYARHLDRLNKNTVNQTFIRTLGRTGMIQKSGVMPGTLGAEIRTNLCRYFDAGSTSAKLAVLARVLHNKNFAPYLTYVEEFYRKHKPRFGSAYYDIKNNQRVRHHVLKMIDVSIDMPFTRIDLVNFASAVGWIDSEQRTTYVERIVRDLFSGKMNADKVFDVCSVATRHREFIGKYVNLDFLKTVRPPDQWNESYLEMVGCLRPQGAALQNKVAEFLDPDRFGWKYRWAAAYTFLDTKPRTDYVRRMLLQATSDPNRVVRETARQAAKNWKMKAPPPETRKRRRSTRTTTAPRAVQPGTNPPATRGIDDAPRPTPGSTPPRQRRGIDDAPRRVDQPDRGRMHFGGVNSGQR